MEKGFFEYSGHSNINFNWNTDSNFVVLHAGATPGYEIVSLELSTGSFYEDGSILKTSFERYQEKEMLIVHVDEENFRAGIYGPVPTFILSDQTKCFERQRTNSVNPCFSAEIGNEYNIRVQFKNWLAKSNTGLYESSYIDEVCS